MTTDVQLSKIYRAFRAIDPEAWKKIAAYFERHENELRLLDDERFFECLTTFCRALFESERFNEHLAVTDEALEMVFENDFECWQGEDFLGDLLLQKARSHFQLFQFDRAEHVLSELIKLRPRHADGKKFWQKVKRERRHKARLRARAFSLACFLAAGLLAGAQFLAARPFFPAFEVWFFRAWMSLLMLGWAVLLGFEAWSAARAAAEVEGFARRKRGA